MATRKSKQSTKLGESVLERMAEAALQKKKRSPRVDTRPPVAFTDVSVDVASVAPTSHVPPEEEQVKLANKGTIAFGTTSYTLEADGTISTIDGRRIWNHGDRDTSFVAGRITDVHSVHGIPCASGLHVIFGPANTGKTPLLEHIAGETNATLIRAGEPFPGYLRSTADLAAAMIGATTNVICVDSLKNVTGRLSGGLMASGLSREFFAMLSDLSSFFAERGQAVFVVVNISTTSDEAIQAAIQALESNSIGIWRVKEQNRVDWLIRGNAGTKRRKGSATMVWAGDGRIKTVTTEGLDARATTSVIRAQMITGDVPVASSLNRALNRVVRTTTRDDDYNN